MIVPMQKYAFMAHRDDFGGFLRELRRLGVVHVRERQRADNGEEDDPLRQQKDLQRAISILERLQDGAVETGIPAGDGFQLAEHILELQEDEDRAKQELQLLERNLADLAPWGDFSLETLRNLEDAGWKIRLYSTPSRKYQPIWEKMYYAWVVDSRPPTLYFALAHRVGEEPEIDAEEIFWPERDPAALRARIAEEKDKIAVHDKNLGGFAAKGLPLLREALLKWQEKYDWNRVVSHTAKEVDNQVMILEGFAPRDKVDALEAALEKANIIYFKEDPAPEDKPPVLLRNNRFSRLFEPIGGLFALPSYSELDLTPFFAPFFMLFFGFCLGDAGYGIVVLLGATLYKRKADASWKPILSLVQFLGLATIFMGAFTGTFFGLSLLDEQFSWLGRAQDFMIDSNQAFNVALILGLAQMLFGLAVQTANRYKQQGFQYALPTVGWIILLLSILDLALLKLTGPVSTWTAWTGVGMIVLFSDPKAGILGRIGKGLWDLYGITGFFGDLLSYIRLFALGISSAILGFVVNDIALQIKGVAPVIGPILFVVFLVIGHGANLLIASLGSFVHPMRLTFVEFYKNAGFEGGGKAYTPFARRIKKEA
jgi:V/A-type H+/Na+-transporting ATPase subunit I